jgi:hypothetical protein
MGILSFTWIIIGGGVAENACTCCVTSMMILLIEQTTAVAMMDGIVYRMMIALIIIRAERILCLRCVVQRCQRSTFNEPICNHMTSSPIELKTENEYDITHTSQITDHRSLANGQFTRVSSHVTNTKQQTSQATK